MSNAAPGDQKNVTVLAVIADKGDRDAVRAIFRHSNWILSFAASIDETIRFLAGTSVPLILCDCDLPDGSWQDLQLVVREFRVWAEALNPGCYGVLSARPRTYAMAGAAT
jgi:hypothetical protein